VELFRNTNIDFLGKKWYFLAFSLIFSVAGICSMLFWHHIPLGVEFRGGTLVYVKFAQTPDLDQIRRQTAPGYTIPRFRASGRPRIMKFWSISASRKPARRHSIKARTRSSTRWNRQMPPASRTLTTRARPACSNI
jgi:preprotein translocase subunit SecF